MNTTHTQFHTVLCKELVPGATVLGMYDLGSGYLGVIICIVIISRDVKLGKIVYLSNNQINTCYVHGDQPFMNVAMVI